MDPRAHPSRRVATGCARYEPTAEPGTARGIQRFQAYVLADNARMLRLLSAHTRILERRAAGGIIELLFEPSPAPS